MTIHFTPPDKEPSYSAMFEANQINHMTFASLSVWNWQDESAVAQTSVAARSGHAGIDTTKAHCHSSFPIYVDRSRRTTAMEHKVHIGHVVSGSNDSMPAHDRPPTTGARSVGTLAVGALALGALAFGALAIGALAVGRLAIGRLAMGRARIRRLEIDELVVRRHRSGGDPGHTMD
jgi:hypothetical protein